MRKTITPATNSRIGNCYKAPSEIYKNQKKCRTYKKYIIYQEHHCIRSFSFSFNLQQTGNWKWPRHILQNLIQCHTFCLISCWFGNKYIFLLTIIVLGFTLCFCAQLDPFGVRLNRTKRYFLTVSQMLIE